ALQEIDGDGMMLGGRNDDDSGFDERQQESVIEKSAGPTALGDSLGLSGTGVRDANEFDPRQVGQNAGVFLAQVSNADHSYPQAFHSPLISILEPQRHRGTEKTRQGDKER